MSTSFGSTLNTLRRELGLSQAALADKLRTTQRHVSFLETGRSQPGRAMLGRLVTDLGVNAAQRANLFAASGFHNPYKKRTLSSAEVSQTLDMIEKRLLAHWPFPAFVLDTDWNVLRANSQAQAMFAPFGALADGSLNVFTLFLSAAFRQIVDNWQEASTSLYFRLQAAAMHSDQIKNSFEDACATGLFDHISQSITSATDMPVFVPVVLNQPDGSKLRATSLLGHLVSVHDALVEGFEIELMLPVDEESEKCMFKNSTTRSA